jgi:WD40 repeat protein
MSSTKDTPPAIPDHELVEFVGEGSYGEVWRARSVLGAGRAVKFVRRDRFDSPRPYEREYVGIQRFEPLSRRHEGLVDVLHVGRIPDGSLFYYVMELADPVPVRESGGSENVTGGPGQLGLEADSGGEGRSGLSPYRPLTLRALIRLRGRLSVEDAAELGVTLCSALHHLHRHGLVHRDLKPSNVIFVEGQPKLADIGLVTGLDEAKSFVGTEGYIPPEGPGTIAADVYSLGKVLYEAATGRDRNDFPDLPDEFRSGASEAERFADLNEVLLRACAPDPADRYPSMERMRAELLLLQAGESVRGLRANERLLRRLKWSAAIGSLLVLLAIAVGWWERQRAFERMAQLQELAAKEEQRRRTAYAADLAIAYQGWETGRAELTRQLLDEQRPPPDRGDLRGWEWRHLWAQSRTREIRQFRTDSAYGFWSCALSPDGRTVAGGTADGQVHLWNPHDGEPLGQLNGANFNDPVDSLVFTRDGRTLIQSLRFSGQVVAWDLTTRQTQFRFGPGRSGVRQALSPDESLIATADGPAYVATGPGEVRLWDATNRRELARSAPQPTFLIRMEFSPEGRHLATTGGRGHAKIWSVPDLREITVLPHENGREIFGLAFSPDGERLVTGSLDGLVRVWNWRSGQLLALWSGHPFGVEAARWSPDGSLLATGGRDQIVRLWHGTHFAEVAAFKGHAARGNGLVFSSDGGRLVSASEDKTIRLWEVPKMPGNPGLHPWASSIFDPELALSPDSKWLALRGRSNGVELLSLPALAVVGRVAGDRPVFGPESRWVVTRVTNRLEAFSVPEGRPLFAVNASEPLLGTPAVAPDGRHLAAATTGGAVMLWAITNPVPALRLASPTNRLEGLFYTPDGRELITLSAADGRLRWFDVATGQMRRELPTGQESVTSAALSPEGTFVLIGETASRVRLVELATGRSELLSGDTGSVLSVAWSPDGQTLAAGTFEGFIKLWNTRTRRELAALRGHTSMVTALEFSRDGRHLVSGSVDNTWRIWSAPILAETDR